MLSYPNFKKILITSATSLILLVSSSSHALKVTNDPWINRDSKDDCQIVEDTIITPYDDPIYEEESGEDGRTIVKRYKPVETITDDARLNTVYNLRMTIKRASDRVGKQLTHTTRYVFFGYPIRKMVEYTNERNEGAFSMAKMLIHNFIIIPLIYYPIATVAMLIAVPPVKLISMLPVGAVNSVYFTLKEALRKKLGQKTIPVRVHQNDPEMRHFLEDIDRRDFSGSNVHELYKATLERMPPEERDNLPKDHFVENFLKQSELAIPNVPVTFNEFKEGFSEDFVRTWETNKRNL